MVSNSAALLSLATFCRWWDHKARKWYYHSIQGEEEVDGYDWSDILLLFSHWLNVAGGGITRHRKWYYHSIQGEEEVNGHMIGQNSVALLSLAACCKWWDHKARK